MSNKLSSLNDDGVFAGESEVTEMKVGVGTVDSGSAEGFGEVSALTDSSWRDLVSCIQGLMKAGKITSADVKDELGKNDEKNGDYNNSIGEKFTSGVGPW